MIDYTEASDAPTVARWQTGYEIPLNVTAATTEDGRTVWRYQRCLVPSSLTTLDIRGAIDRDFGGDDALYAEAISKAKQVIINEATQAAIVDALAQIAGVTL